MLSQPEVRILVGFDASDDSLAALEFAAREAVLRSGTLHVVYAVDDTVLNSAWGIVFDVEAVRQGGARVLDRARELAEGWGVPEASITTETLLGQPPAVLSKLTETSTLALVGRRAESGVHSVFVGSTAVGLAGTASCPVIVVSAVNEAQPIQHGVIGVGIDPAGQGAVALEWAMWRASRLGSRVRVLSVLRPPQPRFFAAGPGPSEEQREQARQDVQSRIDALVTSLQARVPGVACEVEVRHGSPVDELVALSGEVDMVIAGVHPTFPTYSVGGIVRGLMTHASCPLGLIRH